MSLSTLCGYLKLKDTEQGKVHEQPAIQLVPAKESTKELGKIEIDLQISPNATGGDAKNNITKN
eukprot:3826502-Ditylum_brightwellii.AAC.1